jgi:hypothetical protein
MFAWNPAMESVALDPDPVIGGEWALAEDANRIPWCSPVPSGTQIAFDDVLFSLHACPLAQVIPLADRKRHARPDTARRFA